MLIRSLNRMTSLEILDRLGPILRYNNSISLLVKESLVSKFLCNTATHHGPCHSDQNPVTKKQELSRLIQGRFLRCSQFCATFRQNSNRLRRDGRAPEVERAGRSSVDACRSPSWNRVASDDPRRSADGVRIGAAGPRDPASLVSADSPASLSSMTVKTRKASVEAVKRRNAICYKTKSLY